MKKLDFFKYAAFLAGIVLLFVAGCSDDDSSGSGSGTIPTEPEAVAVPQNSLTKGSAGKNYDVTRNKLNDFISVFKSANYYSGTNNTSAQRADDIPEQYEKTTRTGNSANTIYGSRDGHVDIAGKRESSEVTDYTSGTLKFFDFSNSPIPNNAYYSDTNFLYLGGAVSHLKTTDKFDNPHLGGYTTKVKGQINFAGKYKGKVVFDNLAVETRYRREQHSNGSWYIAQNYPPSISRGKFYVQSDGGEEISLDVSHLFDFISPRGNYTSYPEEQITINNMPAVPAAPNGTLSEHPGDNTPVDYDNVIDFFRAFIGETEYRSNASRAKNETKTTGEELKHGIKSGYVTIKDNMTSQTTINNKYYWSMTGTAKYDNYSNKGDLYFGGGYGAAEYGSNPMDNVVDEKFETIMNGTMKFNGKFKGEIAFKDFRYKYEDIRNASSGYELFWRVSGSVKIGNIDVTEEYVKYVLNGYKYPIPPDNNEIVGLYTASDVFYSSIAGEEIDGLISFYQTITINSDGTVYVTLTLSRDGIIVVEQDGTSTYAYDKKTKRGIIFNGGDEDLPFSYDAENHSIFVEGIGDEREGLLFTMRVNIDDAIAGFYTASEEIYDNDILISLVDYALIVNSDGTVYVMFAVTENESIVNKGVWVKGSYTYNKQTKIGYINAELKFTYNAENHSIYVEGVGVKVEGMRFAKK